MAPFGLGRKKDDDEPSTSSPQDLTDKEAAEEISKIASRLQPDEKVLVVARQSRVKPGGSLTTPNIIFATDKRLIIRDPSMLGLKESVGDVPYDKINTVNIRKGVLSSTLTIMAPGLDLFRLRSSMTPSFGFAGFGMNSYKVQADGMIEGLPKDKAEKIMECIQHGMESARKAGSQKDSMGVNNPPSLADELAKLAKLKEQGIISKEEFQQMKRKILKSD